MKNLKYTDKPLLFTSVLLFLIGLVMIFSSSNIAAFMRYNSLTKQMIPHGDKSCTDEEIKSLNNIIYNKFKFSKLILENDYYRKLYKSLGLEIKE